MVPLILIGCHSNHKYFSVFTATIHSCVIA